MRYEYDVEREMFVRIDGRGRPLEFNICEGKRIDSLRKLGYSVQKIYDKLDFDNNVSITNLRTFIKNLENGELSVEGDYPSPTKIFKSMDNEVKFTELENRIAHLEEKINNNDNRKSRVRKWLKL